MKPIPSVLVAAALALSATVPASASGVPMSHPAAGSTSADREQAQPADKPKEMLAQPGRAIAYSELQRLITEKRVVRATISPDTSKVVVDVRKDRGLVRLNTSTPLASDTADKIVASGAKVDVLEVRGRRGGGVLGLVLTVLLPIVLIGGLLVFMHRQQARQRQRLAGKNATQAATAPAVRFRDVAGCDEAVVELKEFLQFLRHPERFQALGAKMPSGALLYGPPGTGKTLLAKALAGEAGVPFFAASGSDFVEMYVGVGAQRVRTLFEQAARCERGAVIFIDEIDAIGKARGGAGSGGAANDERDQTLNQLLVCMDGFDSSSKVVVLAATNRKELLDSALLRPGRLSRHIQVGLPSRDGRLHILGVHAKSKALHADASLERLADVTAGSSGADLADMLNEAAIMAAREGAATISQTHLEEGHLRALAGPERADQSISEQEQRIVAVHEAGHVLCAELSVEHEKAQRATIKARGQAAGLAIYGQVDRSLHSTRYIHERLICALGGRAAESVVFGTVSSGAANDLQVVNSLARTAVEELGFSPRAGQLVSRASGQHVPVAESTRAVIDQEVERIVADAYRDAIALLREHRAELDALAAKLLEAGDIDRLEILAAIGDAATCPRGEVEGPQLGPAEPTAAIDDDGDLDDDGDVVAVPAPGLLARLRAAARRPASVPAAPPVAAARRPAQRGAR